MKTILTVALFSVLAAAQMQNVTLTLSAKIAGKNWVALSYTIADDCKTPRRQGCTPHGDTFRISRKVAGGAYQEVVAGLPSTTYVDIPARGATYTYIVEAQVLKAGASSKVATSNEVTITVP